MIRGDQIIETDFKTFECVISSKESRREESSFYCNSHPCFVARFKLLVENQANVHNYVKGLPGRYGVVVFNPGHDLKATLATLLYVIIIVNTSVQCQRARGRSFFVKSNRFTLPLVSKLVLVSYLHRLLVGQLCKFIGILNNKLLSSDDAFEFQFHCDEVDSLPHFLLVFRLVFRSC